MRFMMIVYPGIPKDAKWMPSATDVAKMNAYNEELVKAGALIAMDGLQPPEKGFRVRYANGKSSISDGPFAEAKEVVGGFSIIQAKSLDEAKEWGRRIPYMNESHVIEVRQIFEMSDFPQDVQDAASSELVMEIATRMQGGR